MSVYGAVTIPALPTPEISVKFNKKDAEQSTVFRINLMTMKVSSSQATSEKHASGMEAASENKDGIDLKIVAQKKRSQRKIYRPKVFKEGKPSKAPRIATPPGEADRQSGRKEFTSCERKYARRKKGAMHSSESASNVLGEIVTAESDREFKSVRRRLNFELEQQTLDESVATNSSIKKRANSVEIENQGAVKPSIGTVFNPNSLAFQSQIEHSNMLQIAAPARLTKSNPAPIKLIPFLKSSVNHFKAHAREAACLGLAAVNAASSGQLNQKRNSDARLKGSKRAGTSIDKARVAALKGRIRPYKLQVYSCKSYDSGWKGSYPKGTHKRKRMKKCGCSETNPTADISAQSSIFSGVDGVVETLSRLNISSCHEVSNFQEQNSIVPFAGYGGMMVTYNRKFHQIKRERPRAKVDLDSESIRAWKLLMGKDCGDEDENSNVDKEQCWEEERKVYSGRADHFIAQMRLVQGDRRFSQWKGSVVDSVVGVFLTQNVSDHLSSSAFMALAANFPLSRGKHNLQNKEKVIKSIKSQNLLYHRSFKCSLEKMGRNKINSQSEILRNGNTSIVTYYSRQKSRRKRIDLQEKEVTSHHESTVSGFGTSRAEINHIRLPKDYRTSQKFTISSPNLIGFHMLPSTQFCQFEHPLKVKIMMNIDDLLNYNIRAHLLPFSCKIISGNGIKAVSRKYSKSDGNIVEFTSFPHKLPSSSRIEAAIDRVMSISKLTTTNRKNATQDFIKPAKNVNLNACSSLQTENSRRSEKKDGNLILSREKIDDAVRDPNQLETFGNPQSKLSNYGKDYNLDVPDKAESNLKAETYIFSSKVSIEKPISSAKDKKKSPDVEKNYFDWERWRKEVYCCKTTRERSSTTMDSLDWEAVRNADVSKISEAIRVRGMNNVLAERIKEFLNRLVRDHGSIDLEWLRDAPPDKVKDYLLSVRGLGLKSVECVRLLALQQLAFPVDTNVGRICVRLGWVPLQPLPESLQLHLLELYPVLNTIQKYLWPRLCKLDQRTLYELHYQMITFGKIFCTKSKPNCNACPMKGECKHFASAFASAKFALPAPEDKSTMSLTTRITFEERQPPFISSTPFLQFDESSKSSEYIYLNNCEPIVEEPSSLEPDSPKALESAIEDTFYEDLDEIPTIKLNFKEFTKNLQSYMEENTEHNDYNLSKALISLTPEAASIIMPKLKNVTRLRTERQVYEIPDTHPLLKEVDPREPDDPSPYLLSTWTPGEPTNSIEPSEACCDSQNIGELCEMSTCFNCNSKREDESHEVRGTLLIPCRTAMRGCFPLNGTYFQVNEVFADHHSSYNPIYIPRDWIWNLPRRTVYFGTSMPTIFRGLTTERIQQCFWRGFVCVRGFDRVTKAPKPLHSRLHFPRRTSPVGVTETLLSF